MEMYQEQCSEKEPFGVFREFCGFNVMVHLMFLSGLHTCVRVNAARKARITHLVKNQVL